MRFVNADTEIPSLFAARPKCCESVTAMKDSTAVRSRSMELSFHPIVGDLYLTFKGAALIGKDGPTAGGRSSCRQPRTERPHQRGRGHERTAQCRWTPPTTGRPWSPQSW